MDKDTLKAIKIIRNLLCELIRCESRGISYLNEDKVVKDCQDLYKIIKDNKEK